MNKTILAEVMQAYADCTDFQSEEALRKRKLNFVASAPVNAKQLKVILTKAIPDGYNNFDSEKVGNFLLINCPTCQFTIGREMSPALYVTGPQNEIQKLRRSYDEILVDSCTPKNDGLRIWWD